MVSSIAAGVRADDSDTDKAVAKLKAAQDARTAERGKLVQISAGELDDLRQRVRMLQTENAVLKKKLADATTDQTAPIVKKKRTEIEIGMTKVELKLFLASHKQYQISSQGIIASVPAGLGQTAIPKRETMNIMYVVPEQVDVGQRDVGGLTQKQYETRNAEKGRVYVELVDDVVVVVTKDGW